MKRLLLVLVLSAALSGCQETVQIIPPWMVSPQDHDLRCVNDECRVTPGVGRGRFRMGRKVTNVPLEKRKELFLEQLRKEPNITKAAKAAGYTRRHVYRLKEEDPEFAAAWEDALQESLDLCEGELHRRAFRGTLKPVFQGGEEVGRIREYSDTLAIFLMKAHRPEKYRENWSVQHTGKDGGPIETKTTHDLSALSLEELHVLRDIVTKTTAT